MAGSKHTRLVSVCITVFLLVLVKDLHGLPLTEEREARDLPVTYVEINHQDTAKYIKMYENGTISAVAEANDPGAKFIVELEDGKFTFRSNLYRNKFLGITGDGKIKAINMPPEDDDTTASSRSIYFTNIANTYLFANVPPERTCFLAFDMNTGKAVDEPCEISLSNQNTQAAFSLIFSVGFSQ